jgi:acyl transferase domain-containing protein
VTQQQRDAVAITGLGAVFPGAGDAAAFWRNIKAGADAITEVTPDRWDPAVYCDPEQAGAAHFYTRRGGFLGELATFSPRPFGIMPSSVGATEADQLLMLRAAAAAIDDCGGLPERDRVGVIVGRGGYLTAGMTRMDQRVNAGHQLTAVLADLVPGLSPERLAAVRSAFEERLGRDEPQDAIGLVPNFSASRLANRFDLHGPSYTVDAACASSLLAVDHAVRELTSGRCDAMLAGGVHVCHHPTLWGVFTRLRVLSPRGVIRPFDAAADGTLLSEGAGVVVLKRLADAERDGDRIYAVIRGIGVSSDGRASSMLNPLVEGQERAIRAAWAAAGLDPAAPGALDLLEAHGTATPTGDLAELTALSRVFGPPASAGEPKIGIGTVKSMIGHAMPAAGIAGLIKTAFAVHEGVLPPTLHVDEPSPALAETRFAPVTEAREWDKGGRPVRRAAVSAFGFGGINAHVVLESAASARPAGRGRHAAATPRGGEPAASGGNETVLRLAGSSPAALAAGLAAPDAVLLARADSASKTTEPHFAAGPCRLAIVAPDERRLALARKIVERGAPWRGRSDIWFSPQPLLRDPGQVAFLYPGFEPGSEPRADGVAAALGLPEPRLHACAPGEVESGDDAVRHATGIIAVGRLHTAALGKLGVSPGVLAGHSLGEWTAMVTAGIYPDIDQFLASVQPGLVELPDVVYLALGASAARALALIGDLPGTVLTHDNCPRQSVVCGPAEQITTAAQRAREAGLLAQAMPFRTGFHSPALGPHVTPIRQAQESLTVRAPQVPVWSATTIAPFPDAPDEIRALVLRHLVEPVRFRQLIERLHDSGIRAFVQIGPGSLTGFTDDTLAGRDYLTVATATPKRDGLAQLRRAAAALWAEGLSPRFEPLTAPAPASPAAEPEPAARRADGAAAELAGAVPLRLGAPLVRLTGAVGPLWDAGALAGAFPPAAGRPALAELNALLSETAAAAESVIAALARPVTVPGPPADNPPLPALTPQAVPASPAAAPPPDPSGAPGEIRAEREFSLRTMPEIIDHCMVPQPHGWHDDTDRFPVVPMTGMLEIMADAARELAPGRVVTGFQQVRALRWLIVAPPARTVVHARSAPGPDDGAPCDRVRVSIEGYASGYVLLADAYPVAPAADETPLRDQWAPPVSARELYSNRWMFHGPRFAGVASVGALASDGIAGSVFSMPTPGALLDSVGQLVGHWMQIVPTSDQTVLPSGIAGIRFFGPQPPAGQPLAVTGRIRKLTSTEMRADAEIRSADGAVWCQIDGWAVRRFATDPVILDAKRDPARYGLAVQAADGWTVAHERWQDMASRELVVRLYLNAAERAEYERVPPPGQRRWLLSRIAVKDAVRRSLWERGAGPVFPAELTVTETGDGIRVRGALSTPPVSLALSPDAPGRPYAAAIAGSRAGCSIQPGPGGTLLLADPGRPGAPAEITPDSGTPVAMATSSVSVHPVKTPEGHR